MRTPRHPLAAALFGLLSLAHLHLVASVALGFGSEPRAILLGHMGCLLIALTAATAAWRGSSSLWRVVAGYGLAAAALTLTVVPALQLPAEERSGLYLTAGIVVTLAGVGAWRLRRG